MESTTKGLVKLQSVRFVENPKSKFQKFKIQNPKIQIGVHHQSLIVLPALVKLQSVEFFENLKCLRLDNSNYKINTSEIVSPSPSLIVPNKGSISCGKVINLRSKVMLSISDSQHP